MSALLSNEYVLTTIDALVYMASAFVLFFIGKIVYGIFHPSIKVKSELVAKDNFAFAVAHTGYFVGVIFALVACIQGPSNGLLTDVTDIFVYGLLAIILLNISTLINDAVILRKFSIRKEIIEDQNAGTGVVEAASAIGSGMIIYGAISGESGSLMFGIGSAVAFWFVGQIAMVIISFIYNAITPYDIHEHIEKDNVAVGVGFAGALIAVANLIRFALDGDFEGWGVSFTNVGFEVVVGIILLPIIRFLTDKILLPGRNLTDEMVNQEKPNVGAALIEAFAYIGGSVLITYCL